VVVHPVETDHIKADDERDVVATMPVHVVQHLAVGVPVGHIQLEGEQRDGDRDDRVGEEGQPLGG
jgi:hypothetical protein